MLCFMFIICVLLQTTSSQVIDKTTHTVFFQIAGLFENSSVSQRLAFKESMRDAKLVMGSQSNNRNEALRDFRLEPVILQLDKTDSYSVWKNLCSNKTMRPIAIFGPQDPISDGTVRDQCSIANIPHIQATWKPLDTDTEEEEIAEVNEKTTFKKMSINFYPRAEEILQAYAELLKYYKWENFAVLYEDDFGLSRIQKILAEFTDHFPVTVRKLDPTQDNVKIFKDLSAFKDSRMIMDCHEDRILKYLEEARSVNMCNEYQHYILTNMDTSKVADKLTPFRSNITWLSMAEYDKLQDSKHFLVSRVGKWTSDIPTSLSPPVTTFKLEALIMNDVANHVLKAVKDLISDDVMRSPYSSLCEADAEPWHFGALLQEKIIHTKSTGVTGPIEFNEKGDRVNYTLYINEIYESELDTIGTWDSSTSGPIVEDRPLPKTTGTQKNSKHFIVISRKTKPYFYEKVKCPEDNKTCVEETADENYEGYSVDLVNRIFSTLRKYNFNYTYSFLDKGYKDYGSYDSKTKKWDGMIGDLLDKKADLAVCDLTITEKRKKVVDFSVPFMSLGISILYTKEKKVPPGMFSFLKPYSFDVWMYTATAYCVVSIVLFVCSRISPADWENPQPCDKDPEELENIWNFKNCTWLTMGSIMTQGCDILPKAIGSRWVCAMWWFFAVIVCQTYIAQLSASMTSALENEPINNVEDLAKQTKVLYGAIKAGSTLDFFKYSKDKMYKQMYENMMANPAVLVKTNDEGEKRVLSGKNKYAFLMESTTIEYKLKRNCELKKVGEELDSKDYGIAMPANSPFRTHINRAILELKELTVIDEIKKKWWEEKNDAKQCDDEKDENDAEGDLEMQNLMGAFIVLIVGLVFSLFITAAEFMNEVRNIVVREKVPHKEVFMKELKASLNFFQMQKPVLRNPSRAPSIASQAENNEKETNRLNAVDNFITFEKGEN